MSAVLIVVMALAAFRLWRLVARDLWPPSVWLRGVVEYRAKSSGHWDTLYDWLLCPWCLGAWLAAVIVAVVDVWFEPLAVPVLQWAAVSAICGLVSETLDG